MKTNPVLPYADLTNANVSRSDTKISFPGVLSDSDSLLPESKRILLVDDDSSILKMCSKFLELKGYQARSVMNGREACELVRNSALPFDLVLTDIMMPEMNGVDLYRALKKEYPDLCVAFMSGYKAEAERDLHLPQNIHFLAKPFDSFQLLDFILPLL